MVKWLMIFWLDSHQDCQGCTAWHLLISRGLCHIIGHGGGVGIEVLRGGLRGNGFVVLVEEPIKF